MAGVLIDARDMDRRGFLGRVGGLLAVTVIDVPRDLEHPDPRPGITSEHVISVEALGPKRPKKVLDAFDAARTYPEIFDGIACSCSCGGKNGSHRSLLVCFETMQPTGCLECQMEAALVGRLARDQKSLAEIRVAVDKEFN